MSDPNPFMKLPIGDGNYATLCFYREGKLIDPTRGDIDLLLRYLELMREAVAEPPAIEPRQIHAD